MFLSVYCSTKRTTLYLPGVLGLVSSHPSEASPRPSSTAVHDNSISRAFLVSVLSFRPSASSGGVGHTAMGEIFWRETSLPPSLSSQSPPTQHKHYADSEHHNTEWHRMVTPTSRTQGIFLSKIYCFRFFLKLLLCWAGLYTSPQFMVAGFLSNISF